jgi:hypothetical protein
MRRSSTISDPVIPSPTDEQLASLKEVLQPRSKTPLSDEYVRESYRNLMGFGMTLLKWKREQRRAEADGPRDPEGDSVPAGYRVDPSEGVQKS